MQLYSRNQPTAEETESLTTPELHNTVRIKLHTTMQY